MKFRIAISGVTTHLKEAASKRSLLKLMTTDSFYQRMFADKRKVSVIPWNEEGCSVADLIGLLQKCDPKAKIVFPSAGGTHLSGHPLNYVRAIDKIETRGWASAVGKQDEAVTTICLESNVMSSTAN